MVSLSPDPLPLTPLPGTLLLYPGPTIQGVCRRASAFNCNSSLRITATKAKLPGFPRVRDATRQEIEQLKRENSELMQLVGELSLELHRFKKTALPPLHDNGTVA